MYRDVNRAPKFILGVRTTRQEFFAADLAGVDADGLNYQITVPFGEPVALWLYSSDLQFTDEAGTRLDVRSGTRKPYTIAAGVPELKIVLSVIGPLQ